MTTEKDDDASSFDAPDEDAPDEQVAAQGPGFFERIPLALQVLTVAALAGDVQAAQKLRARPAVLDVDTAAGTADKLVELVTSFGKDLELLSAKWMGALGALDQSRDREEMNLIMLAGFTALGTRYHLVERILRRSIPKERLRALDKSHQQRARDFLARPADGQGGIRRVK